LAVLLTGSAVAGTPLDLSTLQKDMPGQRTQILVLGTVHLSGAPKEFKPASLEPVLDRLAAFKPDIITIENISGENCDNTARYPIIYDPESMQRFCRDTAAAKTATGLDVPAAVTEVTRALKTWPSQPTAEQRRHLAALFLAANDDASALVQWLQLPETERHAGNGLDDTLIALLDKQAGANNESSLIAARLAARLGLQRLYAVDDHSGDNIDVGDGKAFAKAIRQAWDSAAESKRPIRARTDELWKGGDMLALYRYINRPEVLRIAIDGDFGAALRDPSPQHFGRLYVAGWETRNLRMVANIHAAFRDTPGARVLSIVGSSHKPWFDNLLGQMQGVEMVDVEGVLE
jgi:hypothetical protein